MSQVYHRLVWHICALATAVFLFTASPAHAATFIVTKTADTADGACNADCSLREAIIAANAAGGADTITLPAGTYVLSIAGTGENASATGDLDITGDLTINGAGAGSTIINANNIDRVFHGVPAAATTITIAISGVTIRGGNSTTLGAGFASDSSTTGNTNLTLTNVIITNNTTTNNGGGIAFLKNIGASNHVLTLNNSTVTNNVALNGGGISCNGCTLNVTASTISTNAASTDGGGIQVAGNTSTLSLMNSTISGNTANGNGGGLTKTFGTGTITVNFSTITNNTADNDNNAAGTGGGMNANSNATIQNSIVQGNANPSSAGTADCAGTVSSNGYNVVGAGTGCPSGGTGDITGAALLGSLQDNGGDPFTHMPGVGSAAIEHIPNGSSGCNGGGSVDQRNGVRANGANRGGVACDSGAVEADTIQQPNAVALQAITLGTQSPSVPVLLFVFLILASLAVVGRRPFGQFPQKSLNKI